MNTQALKDIFEHLVAYQDEMETRKVFPSQENMDELDQLDIPFPMQPSNDHAIIDEIISIGAPATVATTGPRYFGFVTGGTQPISLGAELVTAGWDQNGALTVMSPIAAQLEKVAKRWVLEALHLSEECGVGLVTGATMANFAAICAARHSLLKRKGWDVERYGLFGAPPLKIVVGQEVHISLLKALRLAGLGSENVLRVPTDDNGRMTASLLPDLDDRTILCLQAGNVNTGASDPFEDLIPIAKEANAWVHVDGAFGLWARAVPRLHSLVKGVEGADSWATDSHKWLNVPYDSGIVICREKHDLRSAMSASAAYLIADKEEDPSDFTPEMSRRARGITIWATLKSLGREGLKNLIDRNCSQATLFASLLKEAGIEVMHQVVLNQVLVRFGTDEETLAVIGAIQEEGTCWCGKTKWQGKAAMRISVSSWRTTNQDIRDSAQAIIKAFQEYHAA